MLQNKQSDIDTHYTMYYNIAFVNSERWLAKSRVDITLCQHAKFPATLLLKFLCYIIKEITPPSGVVFPHNFSFFQFPLVLTQLYINTENVLYFLNVTRCIIYISNKVEYLDKE